MTVVYAVAGPGAGARSCTPWRCVPGVAWRRGPSTPGRSGWRATCPCVSSARAEPMAAHRTLRAFAPALVLALFLGMFVPGQGEDPVPPQVPRSVRLPSGVEVPVRAVGTDSRGSSACPRTRGPPGGGGAGPASVTRRGRRCWRRTSTHRARGWDRTPSSTRPGREPVSCCGRRDLRQVFRIRSVRLVPRGSVASRPGLYSPRGERRLVLVTCAPPYDERLGYLNLVVVTAAPTGPARASR